MNNVVEFGVGGIEDGVVVCFLRQDVDDGGLVNF